MVDGTFVLINTGFLFVEIEEDMYVSVGTNGSGSSGVGKRVFVAFDIVKYCCCGVGFRCCEHPLGLREGDEDFIQFGG